MIQISTMLIHHRFDVKIHFNIIKRSSLSLFKLSRVVYLLLILLYKEVDLFRVSHEMLIVEPWPETWCINRANIIKMLMLAK